MFREGDDSRDPVQDQVLAGEAVAVKSRLILGRRGRSGVRVRVVGSDSLAWLEIAESWGCLVEAVVTSSPRELNEVIHLVSNTRTTTVASAFSMPPMTHWEGLLVSTICSDVDAKLVVRLFDRWAPWIAIFAFPSHFNRRKVAKSLPAPQSRYEKKTFFCHHDQLGGVTTSSWHFVHLSRLIAQPSQPTLMTMVTYPRHLQTALDDVARGLSNVKMVSFDTCLDDLGGSIVGGLADKASGCIEPVFSASSTGPDITGLKFANRFFWVQAASVWSAEPVIRRVKAEELHAIWDYEGKLESRKWSSHESASVLKHRISSPPAKILRIFLSKAAEAIARQVLGTAQFIEVRGKPTVAGLTKNITFTPMEDNVTTRIAASQADDAQIDLSIWALPNETPEQANAREVLRRFAARWWAYHQEKKAWEWWDANGKDPCDAAAIHDCIRRCKATNYWQWPRGSRIHFWKFSSEFRDDMRDGVPFFHLGKAPTGMVHNLPAPSREAEVEARKKVFSLKFQWYLERGHVSLVVPRFSVVKIMIDGIVVEIRVVWDSKSNGHNLTLWAPSFMLPDAGDVKEHVVKWLTIPVGQYLEKGSPPQDYTLPERSFIKSIQGDVDVSGMFHNFTAHVNERLNLGVRCIETKNDGSFENSEFLRFNRLHFGGKSSPYLACQGESRILEACKGDRRDPANHWQWDRVHLNLPCSEAYDPSLPRVILIRKDGKVATREATFVDDIHPTGRDEDGDEHTTKACKQLKSGMNTRGNPAADRKYRPPSATPGAWNGIMIHTDTPFPMMSTTQKKWTKLRDGLEWIWEVCQRSDVICTSELRKFAGLAVNVTEVYADGRSYLKGIFNAIEAFRWNRDIDGWRLQDAMDTVAQFEMNEASASAADIGYPRDTKITPEMRLHIEALRTLFAADAPHAVPIRPTDVGKIRYVIGDASAEGFGAGTQYPDLVFEGRDGLWKTEFAEGGSNLREAQNLANHLLSEIKAGNHDGCEVWCFTDNSVWSYVWTKGLSTARHLFYLVLELRIAAREHEVYLKTCHLSGDRMIATGMDGWSRGNHDAGLSLGFDVRLFIPLHRSAWEVTEGALENWCRSWMGLDYSTPLTPEGWFEEGHQPGVHIWSPPPAAGLIALKELARSRQKRPYTTTHVVIIPRLLYQEEWRKRFEKEVDLWFVMHHGTYWPHSTFEPLIVGIHFPLSRSFPWELKMDRDRMVALGRSLSKVSETCHVRLGNHLRELWRSPRSIHEV